MNKVSINRFLEKYFSTSSVFVFFGIVFVLIFCLKSPTDPDMGWHIMDGKYLLENNLKVARQDIFSYTMPDFPLIMHEWITDIVMYWLYAKVGLGSLPIFFALITATAFLIVTLGLAQRREYKVIAVVLVSIASIPISGVRPQMLSLLGLSIVIYIIFRFRKDFDTKSIYYLPLLFFLWVNFHGGFPIGLFFIGVYGGLQLTKHVAWFSLTKLSQRAFLARLKLQHLAGQAQTALQESLVPLKNLYRLGWMLGLSFLATLLNPYGWRVYIEVVTTIFDDYAKSIILEWTPITMANPNSHQFIFYLVLLVILVVFSYRKLDYEYTIICAVFLYLALSSWRHMPIFLIVSIPLWVTIVEALVGNELLVYIRKKSFLVLVVFLLTAVLTTQFWGNLKIFYSLDAISDAAGYPLAATQYLKANPIEGNMYNEYNWGGFLIWQYPEKKVFIDGRMPSWKMGDMSVLEESVTIARSDEGWQDKLDQYNIQFVLVENNLYNMDKYGYLGWQLKYQDPRAMIFARPK